LHCFGCNAPTHAPTEEETLAWAADIVEAVFDAIEFAGNDTEVRRLIEGFGAKVAKGEGTKRKQKKKKNR
jgi:hypothetical protein